MNGSEANYPILILDASSKRVWVGVKPSANELVWEASEEDPSKSLFTLIRKVLQKTGLGLSQIGSVAFCEGPGSMLGIRTATMTLRAWKAIKLPATKHLFAFSSLAIGGRLLETMERSSEECLLIIDARRDSWHAIPYPTPPDAEIEIIENEKLASESRTLVTLDSFACWTKTDAKLVSIPYLPQTAFENDLAFGHLRSVAEATPLSIRPSDFKKWIPKIHSAQAS